MNSKKNTVSPIAPMSLVTIMLSAIFFVATVFGQLEQAQAQEDAQFVTGACCPISKYWKAGHVGILRK